GRAVQRPGAEGFAAAAPRLVLGVVDVEVGFLPVGQGANTTAEAALAPAGGAAVRAGVGLGGTADHADGWQDHGLCSWDTGVTRRCPRTQALSFNPSSSYVSTCRVRGGDEGGVPKKVGKNPTDRGKKGTKKSVLVDGDGGPLAAVIAGANVPDCKLLRETIEAIVAERPEPT